MWVRGTGLVLCFFAVLVGVGPLGPSAGTGSPSVSCGPAADGATIVAGQRVRIYEVSRTEPTGGTRRLEDSLAFGCLIPRGKPRLLGSTLSRLAVYRNKKIGLVDTDTFELRAPWIAYTKTISGIDTWTLYVVAINLRTNRRNVCAVGGGGPDGDRPPANVSEIALAADGTVAWTGTRLVRESYEKQVAVCSRTGEKVIDSGEGIGLHSLKLHGSTLSWTDFGETRTAQLG